MMVLRIQLKMLGEELGFNGADLFAFIRGMKKRKRRKEKRKKEHMRKGD